MWQAIKMSVGSYTAHSKVQYTTSHAYTYIEKTAMLPSFSCYSIAISK